MDSVEKMEKGKTPEIEFDPRLSEEVVSREMDRRERSGDKEALERYHELVDPLYEAHPRKRLQRINEIHDQFFVDFGFEEILRDILTEFPLILEKVRKIYVIRALKEEVADLTMVDEEETEEMAERPDTILFRLSSESFSDIAYLRRVMRHELMHIQDMLDEEFGYNPNPPSLPPLERTLVIDRYSVIWDVYIDSRLLREGKKTVLDKDSHYREFKAFYLKIPQPERTQVFEGLWALEMITHDEILEIAKDANKLLARFTDRKEKIFLPGTPCPLCKFPTYTWMEDIEGCTDKGVIRSIQKDFPKWIPEDGSCERCIEGYKVQLSMNLEGREGWKLLNVK